MTVKEAMTKVSEDRETFPMGWNTDMKEVYAKSGKALYERKQKRIWMLDIATPYNGEANTITLWRDPTKARAAMEADIRETLAHFGWEADTVTRDGEDHAHLENKVEWTITEEDLNA